MNKKLNGLNYDIIHSFYKEVNSHPLVQAGHAVVEFETMFANENSITLGFTVRTANQAMSFSIGTELGDYRRYGEELHDKYVARKVAELDVEFNAAMANVEKTITIFNDPSKWEK